MSGRHFLLKEGSYRQWVDKMSSYPSLYPDEAGYWSSQLAGNKAYETLFISAKNSTKELVFSEAETKALLQECPMAYHTEVNDLLVTVMFSALSALTDNPTVGITMEGHGREPVFEEIDHSRTLGWYTSMYPVCFTLTGNLSADIRQVKEYLRRMPNKGVGFGAFAASKEENYGFSALPPVSFNYLGQFDTPSSGDWQVVLEASGKSMSDLNGDRNLLNINGWVSNGALRFTVSSGLSSEETERFSTAFKASLVSIISHCQDRLSEAGSWHTPSDFPYVNISMQLLDALQGKALSIGNRIVDIYPANSLQQGFVYHAVSQPEDDAYRVQVLYDYWTKLNIEAYLKAWEACIEEYTILRTAFNWEEEFLQVIHQQGVLHYQEYDISHLATRALKNDSIVAIQEEDRKQAFDLTQPTLLRLHIIKQSEGLYTVLESKHHSIVDGWSRPVLLNRLLEHYHAFVNHAPLPLKIDTAYLQTQKYIHQHKNDAAAYWEQRVSEVESVNDINALLDTPVGLDSHKVFENPQFVALEVTGDLYQKLKSFVQQEGVTINTIVQFAWHKLLQVYSGQTQSIVGTTVSGRGIPVEGIESSVGLYINTLPLVVDWDHEDSIVSQLHRIHEGLMDMNNYSFVDLAELQKEYSRLFHSFLVFENYPSDESPGDGDVKVSIRNAVEKANFPLSIIAYEYEGILHIAFQYDGDYLSREKAQTHVESLEYLLTKVVESPECPHHTLCLLRGEQYYQVVFERNATDHGISTNATIHAAFESQVNKSPDQIALVYEGQSMTYQELNRKSNQLARHIREQYLLKTGNELREDTLVPLCMERSLEMVVGILAVLKAGGAYVPMDPNYPRQRMDYILEDTQASLVLVQRSVFVKGSLGFPEEKLVFTDLTEGFYLEQDHTNLGKGHTNSLAYVIYTSGTTGKPKGAMVAHHGVVNLIEELLAVYGIKPLERFALFANYVFDASVEQMFLSLLSGGGLYVLDDKDIMDSGSFIHFIADHQITHLDSTPSYLSSIDPAALKSLKRITFGGEYLSEGLFHKFKQSIPEVVNTYGPTEATITSLISINSHLLNNTPISNIKAYVLDAHGQPVPIGVTGELYIGGAGVARGYLNQKGLTRERFVNNPYATEKDRKKGYVRLYKTGDLARWLENGNMEYMGRNDDQVKIRGYRIELGEVEAALSSVEGVAQSCVLVKEREGNKYLAGYYVLETGLKELDEGYLRDALSSRLPDYMVPAALMRVQGFQLTVNGKLDKRALPDPGFVGQSEYVEPANDLEKVLCDIWAGLLGADRVGVTDHFFRIGGNSILAIQLIQKTNQAVGQELHVQFVFKHPTIRKMLNALREKEQQEMTPGLVKLSPETVNAEEKLFLAPGAGDDISLFYELARLLKQTYTVYGFQSHALHNETTLMETVEAIATRNIQEIQKQDPIGPYHLGGYSFGANVMYEMAIQLVKKGFTVEKLYVFDGMSFFSGVLSPKTDVLFTEALLEAVVALYGDTFGLSLERLKKLPEPVQLKHVYKELMARDVVWMDELKFIRNISVYMHQVKLAGKYRPDHEQKLDCPVSLFRCKDTGELLAEDYGWQKVTDKHVEIHYVEANHRTLLNLPYVTVIAEEIENAVKQTITE